MPPKQRTRPAERRSLPQRESKQLALRGWLVGGLGVAPLAAALYFLLAVRLVPGLPLAGWAARWRYHLQALPLTALPLLLLWFLAWVTRMLFKFN